ncbi:hypothetical protein AIOGIFDO_00525 [Candidatus Methanoperedenaceae archaeon GB37]|nr:hypothetical protein AIOGIFDO_00525 [Candidatus Methanoperedenaceae archaeon GB37]
MYIVHSPLYGIKNRKEGDMEIVLERNYLRMINECCPTPSVVTRAIDAQIPHQRRERQHESSEIRKKVKKV